MRDAGERVREIIEGLAGRDWWARRRASAALQSYDEYSYVACLAEGVRNHDNADARTAAMEVFVSLGPRALPHLEALIRDEDREVRLFAANMLCAIRDTGSVSLLIAAFADEDINVRAACVEALGKIGDSAALGVFWEALQDDPWVAMAAVHALGEMGGPEALDILYQCLDREGLDAPALQAIERAGNRESIGHLAACVRKPRFREAALRAIVTIAGRERIRPNPEYFASLVTTMIEMLKNPDPDIKKYAFVALCWSRDFAVIPYMIDGLKDDELQEYAIEGLWGMGRRALCSIVDELRASAGPHRVVLAKLLSMTGQNVALLQFAEDEDPEVRTEVALSLGALDMARARAALAKMQSDPEEEVRQAARLGLAEMERRGPRE
ncbi:MAG: HEAT repeat domain-containing protein [Nitrospiraceae bacterium]|nr:HEAT repeat domain-containing protein [Nitrospiraceae bacterium]